MIEVDEESRPSDLGRDEDAEEVPDGPTKVSILIRVAEDREESFRRRDGIVQVPDDRGRRVRRRRREGSAKRREQTNGFARDA
jgi:hypothetical protein